MEPRSARRSWAIAGAAAIAVAAVTAVLVVAIGLQRPSSSTQPAIYGPAGRTASSASGLLIPPGNRKPAGPLAGASLNGGSYSLAADRGRVVVVSVFASWCGPCQTLHARLTYLPAKTLSLVHFVGLDVKEVSQATAESWLRSKQVGGPVLWDPAGDLARKLGVAPTTVPDTVLIDKQQRIAAVYTGVPANLDQALRELISE